MQREIKFRAWDTNKQKMYSAYEMGQDELQINPDGRGFFNASSISPKLSEYFPHMIPLQYTGMKDSKGREIYEGDILVVEDTLKERILDDGTGPTEPANHLAPVVFQDGSFGVYIKERGDYFEKGFWSFIGVQDNIGMTLFEVLGNIYQGKELLSPELDKR